ncbi:hypothetical protein OAJ57_05590 [Alphaproteobacteria bacterium]|nr:hypothetical protein [Alphaproteobacteria bacterium]
MRGNIITDEVYDMVVFLTHSFLRPIESEFYGLKHRDITVQDNPKTLQIVLYKGKTRRRISNTLEAGVSAYERICERNPFLKGDIAEKTAARLILATHANPPSLPLTSESRPQ